MTDRKDSDRKKTVRLTEKNKTVTETVTVTEKSDRKYKTVTDRKD